MKISQQDGARLIWAAEKWVGLRAKAAVLNGADRNYGETKQAYDRADEAKDAFAELVAQLTENEGL